MPTTVAKKPARRKPVKRSTMRPVPAAPPAALLLPPSDSALRGFARQLHALTGSLLGGMGTAADLSLSLAAARLSRPGPKAAVTKAAQLLRDSREAAGLTLDDLGEALELKDPSFMSLVESGKVGLPFEMILRMATILGRNDPMTFVLQMTRSYNPRVWATLETLGIGKLLTQAGREREFANIYRAHGTARELSDADFAAALAFTAAAFDSAIRFIEQHDGKAKPSKK